MSPSRPLEIEFKYKADNMTLTDFSEFCSRKVPTKCFNTSGYDHFYSNDKYPDSFYRYRVGADSNQLTFKRKTVEGNSYVRAEHNLNLNKKVTQEQVESYCLEHGYMYNTSIFKTCFVANFDWYVLSYYTVYNKEMTEIGRFFEIEMNEEYDWNSEEEAWNALRDMERLCKPLGINAQGRIKSSLFELYKE